MTRIVRSPPLGPPPLPPLTTTYTNDPTVVATWIEQHVTGFFATEAADTNTHPRTTPGALDGAAISFLGLDTEKRPSFQAGITHPPATLQLATAEGQCLVVHLARLSEHHRAALQRRRLRPNTGEPGDAPPCSRRGNDSPAKGPLRHNNDAPAFEELASVLADPSILKIGASITGDALELWRWFGLEVTGRFDPGGIACDPGGGRSQSLKSAGEMLVPGLVLRKQKRLQMSNWAAPSLSARQVEYAAADAFCGAALFAALVDDGAAAQAAQAAQGIQGIQGTQTPINEVVVQAAAAAARNVIDPQAGKRRGGEPGKRAPKDEKQRGKKTLKKTKGEEVEEDCAAPPSLPSPHPFADLASFAARLAAAERPVPEVAARAEARREAKHRVTALLQAGVEAEARAGARAEARAGQRQGGGRTMLPTRDAAEKETTKRAPPPPPPREPIDPSGRRAKEGTFLLKSHSTQPLSTDSTACKAELRASLAEARRVYHELRPEPPFTFTADELGLAVIAETTNEGPTDEAKQAQSTASGA